MLEAYKKILVQSQKQKTENKKFFERLKKLRPSNLDFITNDLHNKAFEHIDCLQCANCCSTTGPLLLNKDIDRLANNLHERPSIFTDKYLRIDEDGDYIFKQLPCPFLKSDKCCSVYDARPNACREYPHTQQRNVLQKLNITYLNSLICPAVAEVTEGLKAVYASPNKK